MDNPLPESTIACLNEAAPQSGIGVSACLN
jgi:hypothetical protein